MIGWIALALLLIAAIALVVQHDAGTIAGFDTADFAMMAAGLAIVVFIAIPLLSRYQGRISTAVRDFLVWAVAGLVLVAGYSFRDEFMLVADRVMGELTPAGQAIGVETVAGENAVRIRRHSDGQFLARTEIEGESISMIVDTGASTIVLRPADAERAGIDVASLAYTTPVNTANGSTFAARVRLKTVAVGPVIITNVEALVARPGALHESLLGMSFLSRLRSYEFSGDFLTLRG